MNADAADSAAGPDRPREPVARLLDELEAALREQLRCARAEDYTAMLAAGERVAGVLDRLGPMAPAARDAAAEPLRRIAALHHELCLTMQVNRKHLGEELARVGRGGRAVRAYRGGAALR